MASESAAPARKWRPRSAGHGRADEFTTASNRSSLATVSPRLDKCSPYYPVTDSIILSHGFQNERVIP